MTSSMDIKEETDRDRQLETDRQTDTNGLTDVIVQTRVSVLPLISKYRQAGWKYEAQQSCLSVFRNQKMNTFECLNLLLELIDILGENRDYKSQQNLTLIFLWFLNKTD